MRTALCLALFLIVTTPEILHAQNSSVDTLYADTTLIHSGSYDPGDTIWVGIGTANTFAIGAMSYRFELEDTNRIVPAYSVDTNSGALNVLLRLVNRGLTFDTFGAVTSAIIPHADTANIILGVLVDFFGSDSIPIGTGTILEIAFLAKAGIQIGDSTRILVRDDLISGLAPRNSFSDVAGAVSVLPQLRSGLVRFGPPGPVLFDIETSTGNDTLFVGRAGTINFTADANGNDISSLTFPFEMVFSAGNVIGPLNEFGNVNPSAAALNAFESISWNTTFGQGTNPDTILYGFVDFGGPLWDGSGTVWSMDVSASGPGSVRFDTITFPSSHLSAVDVNANDLPIQYLFDGQVIEFVNRPADPIVTIEGSCPTYGHTYEGGGVAVHVMATPQVGAFVSLDLRSITRDGNSAVPTNTPDVTGLGLVDTPDAEELILSWAPAAGEAGTWEFCFMGLNDIGDSGTACYSVDVLAPDADHVAWIPQHFEFREGGGAFADTISFTTTHSYDTTSGIVLPFIISSAGGAFMDTPVLDGDMLAGLDAAYSVFASQSTNSFGNDASTPDSMLYGMIAFSGALAPGTYTNTVAVSLKDVEGIIAIDTAFLAPACCMSFNVKTAEGVDTSIFTTYSPGCFALTIVRNVPPTVLCPVTAVGPIVFGDPVQVSGFSYTDPDDAPGPYTFNIVSATLDGSPALPTNTPFFTGDTFDWQTSNVSNDDVGVWEFCVQVFDGADTSINTCCFEVEVISQVPLVSFRFGCVLDARTGADICVPLFVDNIDDDCKELGGFDLLFTYDASLLTFMGMDLVGSVLESEGWEYFTYRVVSINPAKIRIVAIADMNNSNQHPTSLCLNGLLANVCFKTTADQNAGCQAAHIQFCWDNCGDNTASSPDGNTLYIIANPNGSTPWAGGDPFRGINGGGIINNSCSIDAQWGTFEGGTTGPADFPCLSDDVTKPVPVEGLYFVNGKVNIICLGENCNRGDLNLNGLAYEIADAVAYTNFFILGPLICDPGPCPPDILEASDVNADGVPLTVADLVYLIRVITGDLSPIPCDLLGGGSKVTATVGTVDFDVAQQGSHMSISTFSRMDMGAALFVFKYDFIDISEVTATNRASDMDVSYQAQDGELRVLVYNIEDGARIEAGSGNILNILTTGTGSIELVSVEAASFMGGALETNLHAKVVPEAFALHQNYPNPFNPSTQLTADFPRASEYTLSIYNVTGQLVKTFAGHSEAGTLTLTWDGVDTRGAPVASGVYFYRLQTDTFETVRKMVLMK